MAEPWWIAPAAIAPVAVEFRQRVGGRLQFRFRDLRLAEPEWSAWRTFSRAAFEALAGAAGFRRAG